MVDFPNAISDDKYKALQKEVLVLYENIQKFKQELASVNHPGADHGLIGSASEQLSAIADETAGATDTIMAAAEVISGINDDLLKEIKLGGARPMFHEIADNVGKIFEACSFHDITGQRLTKVVTAITAIEGSLNALVEIVGKDAVAELAPTDHGIDRDDGGITLSGPQLDDSGMSQDDVDKLFD